MLVLRISRRSLSLAPRNAYAWFKWSRDFHEVGSLGAVYRLCWAGQQPAGDDWAAYNVQIDHSGDLSLLWCGLYLAYAHD